MKSDITKKYQILSTLFFWLSIICLVLPIVIYTIMAFINGEEHEKVTLGVTVVIACFLVGINTIFKYHIRSCIWILILGIYFCLDNIMPLLLTVAIATILDEFIFSPLHKKFKNKKNINAEIDKRVGTGNGES